MNTCREPLSTINVNDPFAMRYWARQLRISEAQLRAAIAAAGSNAAAVREQVGKSAPEPGRAGRPRA
ncbi:MAG: DUF3606 domain-containing protein [Rhodanobacter sp.]